MTRLTESKAWHAVLARARELGRYDLRGEYARDPSRFRRLSIEHEGMLLDYSKHLLDEQTVQLLVGLARERDLPGAIEAMFGGQRINNTENRAALHVALRGGPGFGIDGKDVSAGVARVLEKMRAFSERVRSGEHRGHTGAAITDVVNIGIGGSYLGPELACDALQPYSDGRVRVHFLSNVDGEAAHRILATVDAVRTLFVVASKTFTTQETMLNAHTARSWLVGHLGSEAAVARHFVAVSSNVAETALFGIGSDNVFEMWDWVGGRYSLWSAIGLPVALQLGMDQYLQMHAGARTMDAHFRAAPLERNMPAIMGLLDVWYGDALGTTSRAVLPYAQALARLPAYLQQLEMESLGKRVTRSGETVDFATGGVVWGEPGTNGQHAFYQLLHQGTQLIPADLIAACRVRHPHAAHHAALLSNFFAQSEALMKGRTADEARSEMQAAGMASAEAERLAPHRVFPGNRPTTSILVDELDPYHLGMLIALYEHKVYVQSVIWDINAFDQWGVELGKRLADRILPELRSAEDVASHDGSTNGLMNFYRRHRG
ncbi:MAG TPA: glucose-6-phosphate isomerase [Burkholderiales bacterium]|nr:glucose-6-phosphate isomerase [Burkholderiales bacterium]